MKVKKIEYTNSWLDDHLHYFSWIKQNGKIFAIVTKSESGWKTNLYEAEDLKLIPLKHSVSALWRTVENGCEGELFEMTEDCKFLYMGNSDGKLTEWEFLTKDDEFQFQKQENP